MAEKNINAFCSICGKGYHVCRSCREQKVFKPWRSVTDNIEHYKIYLAIHGYTISKNRKNAKAELEKCDLSDLENFKPEIKTAINEIMEEPAQTKTSPRKRKEYIDTSAKKDEISE